MKPFARLTPALPLAIIVIGLSPRLVRAQLAGDAIDYLAQQGQAEGWTFDVGQNPATHRSLESLCELQPPTGWQFSGRVNPFLQLPNGAAALPASFDWRTQSGCTAVRNQGGCGSCWAFATVGVMESALLIKEGQITDLSEQYLVSCNSSGYSCNGGWWAHDYHYNKAGKDAGGIGAVLETAKPYTATNSTCSGALTHLYTVKNWYYVDPYTAVPSTNAIKQAIMTYGPVSAAVYVGSAFQAYTGGVFNACPSGTVNHAIMLVGWNDAENAWILRNSWGPYWGVQGYMKIQYGCSSVGYAASYVDYEAAGQGDAITSPTPSSTLSSNSATFQWSGSSGATEYWLSIGTALGKSDIYSASQGTATSVTVSTLPVAGQTLYVKLFSKIGDKFYGRTYNYTAANIPAASAAITSPSNGATFDSSSVTFEWSAGSRVTDYTLWIGTTAGGYNLYNKSQGLNRSVTVSNLPAGGKKIYVRLISKVGTSTSKNDYIYTSTTNPVAAAIMTSPTPSSTFDGSNVAFAWTEGTGVDEYMIHIGTAVGGKTIYNKSQGKNRTLSLAGVPTKGGTLYVRLWSKIANVWQYNDYQYTAANTSTALAEMTSPTPGSTLESSNATFTWSAGSGVTEYRLNIGTAAGKTDLYNLSQGLNTSVTVTGLPLNGNPIYVRLWSVVGGVAQKRDYTYAAASGTTASAQLTSPAAGSTFTSSLVTFTWDAGVGATEYQLVVGKTVSGKNTVLYSASQALRQSVTVPNLPVDGSTIYVNLSTKIAGKWQTRTYNFKTASAGAARPLP